MRNIHFLGKPRNVTPQINHSLKNEPCSEGFQHTFVVFPRRIDGKMFILE